MAFSYCWFNTVLVYICITQTVVAVGYTYNVLLFYIM